MAKIINFNAGAGNVSSKFSEVECVYNVGIVGEDKVISLSTFGSSSRKKKTAASQVIHLDKKGAEELVKILQETFDI